MSRLYIKSESQAQAVVDELYRSIENRIAASPPGQMCIRDSHRFVQRAALCDEQACHNLRRAGTQAPRPGVLFIEDAPGGAVQQNGAAGRKLRRRLRSAGQQRRKAGKCQRRGYHASQFAR